MGFFLRPKDTNLDRANDHINAEPIELANGGTGKIPTLHPSEAREARRDAPLPSGNWRGGGARTGKVGGSKK